MSICKIKVKYKWGCLCVWVQEKNNKTIYVKKMGGFFSRKVETVNCDVNKNME